MKAADYGKLSGGLLSCSVSSESDNCGKLFDLIPCYFNPPLGVDGVEV